MKASKFIVVSVLFASTAALFLWQHRRAAKLLEENQSLRLRIDQLVATKEELARTTTRPINSRQLPDEQFRELMKLRGEVTVLRRQQDDLLKQLAATATTTVSREQAVVDEAWVQRVLNGGPKDQGIAAGTLRGKLLRREMTNVSPAELALQEELLKRQLNQRLERSPADFAEFQSGFIQQTLGISDEARVGQIRDLIQRTYEQAIANGLDIPSKPLTGAEEWVQRRFDLDRTATGQLKELFTPEERTAFDRAFLGVMGVDLGGGGVDKSNYPKGFLGEP